MESNLSIKTSNIPKFNIKTVSSAVFGKEEGGSNIGGGSGESIRNIHKTLSKLSGHLRNSLVRIKALEGKFSEVANKLIVNTEKTTEIEKKSVVNVERVVKIEKILEKKKDNIGGNQDNLSKSLIETNKILVGIQQQLALQSSNEQKEQKTEVQQEKREKSKKRLKAEESALEKTAKGIGRAVTKTVKKIISPVGNIFDKILEFITLLGAGIAVNAAFAWFQDPKNQEKLTKFFNILKENWQLLAKILGVVGGAILLGKIIGFIGAMTKFGGFILGLAANPLFLAGIGIIMAAAMQGLGREQKEVLKYLEDDMGGITKENREKMIELLKSQRESKLPDGKPNPDYIQPFNLAGRAEIDRKIKFLETGEYDYGGKKQKIDFGFGDFLTITQGTKYNFNTGEEESNSPGGEKPGFTFGGGRAMGGPVTAKTPYLVGEKGPEIFAPNVDGSVINNMKTEKIYQMISSGRKGRGGINMINLPPITNQMPPPEIPVPQGPATEVPDISSVNMADPYRQITPMLYGITV